MPEPVAEALPPRLRAWCMAAALACLLPLLLQVPTLLAIGLGVVAAVGAAVLRPLPVVVRLAMLVSLMGYVMVSHGFSIGRDAGCALLAALLALKPFETHRQNAYDFGAGETADLGFLLACPGRMGGEAGDAGDAGFLTQQVEHLDGFGGQADDALGQAGHGRFREVSGGVQRGKGDGQAWRSRAGLHSCTASRKASAASLGSRAAASTASASPAGRRQARCTT